MSAVDFGPKVEKKAGRVGIKNRAKAGELIDLE